ncbi:MAG: GYF domain-containing protein [Candidatus Nitrosoglobus sp.]|jgi:uncharacterized RDD family membrane protein YckC
MAAWWYAEEDKQYGPVEKDGLTRLIQAGMIGPQTIFWKVGMESWLPLDEIEELRGLNSALPPPLPPKVKGNSPPTYFPASRWPRYFARSFDLSLGALFVTYLLSFVLGFTLAILDHWTGQHPAGFVEWLNGPLAWVYHPLSGILFWMLCLPIVLILDAAAYRFIGNTPGKALLGLRVRLLNASPLSFSQYLGRNFSIWVSGLALGIPFIDLVTMTRQAVRIGRGKPASYDEFPGYRVYAKPIGPQHKLFFVLAFAGLFVLMTVGKTKGRDILDEAAIWGNASKNHSWINPITRISAKIDSRWKVSLKSNALGQQIYVFTEQGDHAVLILAVEQVSGFTLPDYVKAFRENNVANMRLVDNGRYFERLGQQSWQGSGSNIVTSISNRLDVQIAQVGDVFWRVVTVQTLPYDHPDPLVAQLQAELWNTVH